MHDWCVSPSYTVGGPLLLPSQRSGYGKYPITHIHGMTIGELSLIFNQAIRLPVTALEVVPMTGWRRDMLWSSTGLPWVPPSPNLPSVASAVVYGATVFLEATTVSEGRGTTTPFEQFGAPFLSAQVSGFRTDWAASLLGVSCACHHCVLRWLNYCQGYYSYGLL